MVLEFILSEKGKRKLVDGGHLHVKDKDSAEGKIIWKCDKFHSFKCHARLHTMGDEIIKRIGEHNHGGDAARIAAGRIVNGIKERAANSHDGAHRIVSEASIGVPAPAAAHMPSAKSLKRTINRVRHRGGLVDPNPQNRAELQLPAELTVTERGEQFLLFDSGKHENRMLIFGSRGNLRMLSLSQHWYAHGTFKAVPLIFEQLYTIHGIRFHEVIPAVFALLPNKREETYRRMFACLKNEEPGLAPVSIMTDFEMAAINAIQTEFPNAQHRGCFFHFNQCVYQKIQRNGLQSRYDTDQDFALQMRMLPALAFVPPARVADAFIELTDGVQYPNEAQPVVDYFEDTWIGRPTRGNCRRPPMFAHAMWNVHGGVADGLPKTNNSCERWHRSFMELVGSDHPNIWKFLQALKLEQSRNETTVEQYLAGQEPPAGDKKSRDCAARIQRIVQQYDQIELVDYLRGLADNFNFYE